MVSKEEPIRTIEEKNEMFLGRCGVDDDGMPGKRERAGRQASKTRRGETTPQNKQKKKHSAYRLYLFRTFSPNSSSPDMKSCGEVVVGAVPRAMPAEERLVATILLQAVLVGPTKKKALALLAKNTTRKAVIIDIFVILKGEISIVRALSDVYERL